MSNAAKTGAILVIIVILIVVGLVWYFKTPTSSDVTAYNTAPVQTNADVIPATPTAAATTNDTSDAGIQNDLSHVDDQMNGLNGDTSNVDQSMNSAQ